MSATIEVEERAYLMMHLHAVKYHQFDCLGVLIGKKDGRKVIV